MHLLPAGFTKTRHFGGWSNRRREAYLDQCLRLLDAHEDPLSEDADQFQPLTWDTSAERECRCPGCGGPLELVLLELRPSWRELLPRSGRPIRHSSPANVVANRPRRIEFA